MHLKSIGYLQGKNTQLKKIISIIPAAEVEVSQVLKFCGIPTS